MLMSKIYCSSSLALDSAHEKFDVLNRALMYLTANGQDKNTLQIQWANVFKFITLCLGKLAEPWLILAPKIHLISPLGVL